MQIAAHPERCRYLRRHLARYDADAEASARRCRRECRFCAYLRGKGAFQAISRYTCAHCGRTGEHPNSRIPALCDDCAGTLGVCRRCGAPLD